MTISAFEPRPSPMPRILNTMKSTTEKVSNWALAAFMLSVAVHTSHVASISPHVFQATLETFAVAFGVQMTAIYLLRWYRPLPQRPAAQNAPANTG